ncbi:MAG: hypothetical protein IVW51_08935 [Thermaceae bacterium]|nr:hypothetical protein [Thermaceae bacterium]
MKYQTVLLVAIAILGAAIAQKLPVTVLHFDNKIPVGYGVERYLGAQCDKDTYVFASSFSKKEVGCYNWKYTDVGAVLSNLRSRFEDAGYEFMREQPYTLGQITWLEQVWKKEELIVRLMARPTGQTSTNVLFIVIDQSIK